MRGGPTDMDAAVLQAMARWPQVPRCTGWLALDQRGQWWMRHQQGPAIWPRDAQGRLDKTDAGPVLHEGLAAFIGRNYTYDAQGSWYFQNGPQRVDVSLETAPWIVRLHHDPVQGSSWHTHTGLPCTPQELWLDAQGRVWLRTELGPALLHSNDMPLFATLLDAQDDRMLCAGNAALPLGTFSQEPEAILGFRRDPCV